MRGRILIIEDEHEIAAVLAIRLHAAGLTATTARSGAEGLAAMRQERPDAVLLDVRLPDLDGFEVFARMRADPATSHVPVVFLSANVQDSARQAALALGAHAYLTKPYEPREVAATVAAAIASRQPACADRVPA